MNLIQQGSKGTLVQRWQNFLIGQGHAATVVADGYFGPKTTAATKAFQAKVKLKPDGVAGNRTFAAAMRFGFEVIEDDKGILAQSWPPPPKNMKYPNQAQRFKMFGRFKFKHAPTASNPERIIVLDDWAKKNIIKVEVPQLRKAIKSHKGIVWFHRAAARQLQSFFAEVEKKGLLKLVLTWHGSYVPRYIRGSRTYLSNHAFGTAFDINYTWNKLGAMPALKGEKGSVRELAPIANKHGFYWGGHFRNRRDGMHFEVVQLKK